MKISVFKAHLAEMQQINFVHANGHFVPRHFHITEAALNSKHYIDCGGTERKEQLISFQLWTANDFQHRLSPAKLLRVIKIFETKICAEDLEIEIEFQSETIGKYGLGLSGEHFELLPKFTACLAEDACGIQPEQLKKPMSELKSSTTCNPESGCC